MKKILIMLLATTSALAVAADIDGGYVEVQAGSGNSSAFNSGVINSGAMRIDGGVKISPYLGVEAGFTGLTKPTTGPQSPTSTLQFYDASLKGVLPLYDNGLSLHTQAGLAYATGTMPHSGADSTGKILVGAGIDINLSKNLAVALNDYGYISPNLDPGSGMGGNTNVVMAGLKYNF